MPAVKIPCLQCKEKHVRCDEIRPKCGRCEKKQLECTRPSKKTIFRHDASANFSKDQQWVNSAPRHFEFDAHNTGPESGSSEPWTSPRLGDTPQAPGETEPLGSTPASISSSRAFETKRRRTDEAPPTLMREGSSSMSHVTDPVPSPSSLFNPPTQSLPTAFDGSPGPLPPPNGVTLPPIWQSHLPSSWVHSPRSVAPPHKPSDDAGHRRFPLEDVQEACLMRYYVEEIGHWLDLCDPDRHFQLAVPVVARRQPHLLNAVFAVAARHLARMPQYKTPDGTVLYQGQLLPRLDKNTPVEYMLECIPALRRFHDTQDDDYRDSIIATAVILRQLEEIDDEDDGSEYPDNLPTLNPHSTKTQINFLPIIDAVLRSPPSQSLFRQRSLIQAAYWMALRQEIYHSFTRRQAPKMILAAEFWADATSQNKAVMHTVQVMKWRWGDGSEAEWNRLMQQQEHLEQEVLVGFEPIFYKPANKAKGEIFPTLWYTSVIETTTVQQSIMAKSVLLAENPSLRNPASRSSWRKVESRVRELMLDLCGIALCHPASPPAILNAAFVIQMYGDFFTDQYEREALKDVVEKYRATHAWPSQKLTAMFG